MALALARNLTLTTRTRHYRTLDALRGIAAVAVVIFHSGLLFGGFRLESAYLSVDFFFLLSGFVLAHAYDDKIGLKMSGRDFFLRRIVRLFPLYLIGSALTVAAAFVAVFLAHDASQWSAGTLLVSTVLAVVMLPSPVMANLFPLNDSCWSLFFEFLANGVYAARIWQGRRLVWFVPALAAIGLAVEVVVGGSVDRGAEWGDPWWTTLVWGGFRVAFSFPAGLLLYRYRHAIRAPRLPVPVLALILALLLAANPSGPWRAGYDLTFVLILSPAIVVIGCSSEPRSAWQTSVCVFLGSISYPIYVLHRPITSILGGMLRRLLHGPVGPEWQPWAGFAFLAVLVVIAAAADKVDFRVRRDWLVRRPAALEAPPVA